MLPRPFTKRGMVPPPGGQDSVGKMLPTLTFVSEFELRQRLPLASSRGQTRGKAAGVFDGLDIASRHAHASDNRCVWECPSSGV